MNQLSLFALSLTCLQCLSLSSRAHHGRDFILVQDYSQPPAGSGNVTTDFEWSRTDGEDEFTFEPGLFFAPIPRLSLGLSTTFIDENNSWDYASVLPFAHLQLTPPESTFPVKIALMAGYQFASQEEESGHDHDAEHHEEEGTDHHDEASPGESHHQEHAGLHRHHENFFTARLVLETSLTDADTLVLNLINVTPENGRAVWGYAAGYRHTFSHAISIGIEGMGDFGDANEHELVLGAYLSPSHSLTFKLGVGHGLTSSSPDFSLRAGMLWRF